MKSVLFACIHNAGRSQMAAALFEAMADGTKARALSAGTEPGAAVHPEVVTAMREVGIDLAPVAPRRLTDDLAAGVDLLITMGCGEACPIVPGGRRADWALEDPKGKPLEPVRVIRDDIARRVRALVAEHGWTLGSVRAARPDDLAEVEAMLREAGLPTVDVASHFERYRVAESAGRLIGAAGLELHGDAALLRSVVVGAEARGRGIGSSLHRFIASSLHRFIASSLHRFIASSLHRFIASSLHRFIASSLHRFIASSSSLHRFIASSLHRTAARRVPDGRGGEECPGFRTAVPFRVARSPALPPICGETGAAPPLR